MLAYNNQCMTQMDMLNFKVDLHDLETLGQCLPKTFYEVSCLVCHLLYSNEAWATLKLCISRNLTVYYHDYINE